MSEPKWFKSTHGLGKWHRIKSVHPHPDRADVYLALCGTGIGLGSGPTAADMVLTMTTAPRDERCCAKCLRAVRKS